MKYAKSSITGEPTGKTPNVFFQIITKIFGTGLFSGYLPLAQGTAGSLVWVFIWILFVPDNLWFELGICIFINLVSIPISGWGERMWGHDPGRITIDEFAGQAIALIAIPREPLALLTAFLFFRLFDTFKLKWVKENVESIKGGWGVTLDDTIAGIMARICMIPTIYLLKHFNLI